jgi:hypothetical protein
MEVCVWSWALKYLSWEPLLSSKGYNFEVYYKRNGDLTHAYVGGDAFEISEQLVNTALLTL